MATNVKRKKKKAEVMAEDGSMTLTGHLKELRNRLIICAVVFVVGVVVSLAYADRLIDLLTAMGRDYYEFVSASPFWQPWWSLCRWHSTTSMHLQSRA